MSQYTTGEIAKLCGVSVRTVQYYDSRNILTPTALTEGGRRLYSEQDLQKLRVICFLRDLNLPINSIGEFLQSDDPGSTLEILLSQQEQLLREEVAQRQESLEKLDAIRQGLKNENFSVERLGDIAQMMETKQKMKKFRIRMLLSAIPVGILQWGSILLWALTGIWWPFAVYVVVAIPWGIWFSRMYYRTVSYICPKCHKIFKPTFKQMFWANHTPTLRKLTCTCCGEKSWCVETIAE